MTRFAKAVGAVIAALALASCGGGGSNGGSDGGFSTPSLRVTVSPASTQTTPFSLVDVAVRVTSSTGAPANDGTPVTLSVSSGSVGLVSSLTGTGTGTGPVIGERISTTTSGGNANFRLHSRAIGSMTLTASARQETASGTAQASGSAVVNIVAGAPNDPRLTAVAQTTTLPINRFGVSPFLGSPFLTEVTVTLRRLSGELATNVATVGVSVNPVNAVGGFSVLDDPATEDDPTSPEIENNEFLTILGQGPVDMVAGKGTIFFHSFNEAGVAVMTVTAQDPDTNETLQAQISFTTVTGTPALPASISLQRLGRNVYSSESGGNSVEQVEAYVYDAVGTFVPEPVSGQTAYNNVRVEIVGSAQGAERLRAVNAQGQTVSGGAISVRTFQGIAGFSYEAGTRVGTLQIKVTADRADNNVDNGISDPVSSLVNLVVGDGRLFDLDITTPTNAEITEILFNDGVVLQNTGSYLFNISALATDRYGNPVIPGTEIRFGMIDSPHIDGAFAIAGGDGDPQEGGTGFSAPTGAFKTAGGGAGPNDTLIVFGEESTGNRDLESARRIATVPTNTNLTVTQRFNHNDDTGVSVNNGPVLPYVIGRAVDANVTASGFTDQNGVVFAQVAFPVGKVGKLAAIYAQGNGDIVSGSPELVTDAELLRLAALAPGTIIASPDPIAGNTTATVQVCLVDANNQGIPGARLTFSFDELFGVGSVDGIANQGQLANLTGPDGCAEATVVTAGLPTDGGAQLTFSLGEISDTINIRVNNNFYLYAFPSQTFGDGARLIRLRLVDSSGARVPGVLIVGECETNSPAILNIDQHPGLTDANGETTAIVDGTGFATVGGGGPDGSCTFRTINDEAETTVTWGPVDICDGFSPNPPVGCPSANLTLTLVGTGNVASIQPNSAMDCQGPGNCTATFHPFENVTLLASSPGVTWTGPACAVCTGTTCTVTLGADGTNTTCTITFP